MEKLVKILRISERAKEERKSESDAKKTRERISSLRI